MLTVFLTILALGFLAVLVGSLMMIVAAFRQHVLWGLAYLFLPLANVVFLLLHWAAAKKGFLVSLAGLVIFAAPWLCLPEVRGEVLQAAAQRLGVMPGNLPMENGTVPPDLTAQIQAQRENIEQLEGQFAQLSGQLSQRYQSLAATRKALLPGDPAAVARFNDEAAAYQQQTAAQRRMQQDLTAARETLDGLLAARSKAAAGAHPASAKGPVILYSTARCPACVMAKQYFAQRGVSYETRDVEQSPAAMAEFRRLGGRGVPLILVGAKQMEGFDSRALDAML